MTCACKCVDKEDGSCREDEECDDVPFCTLCNDPDTWHPDPGPVRVPIPTVVYQQKYVVKKILCSSDPLFCDK